MNHQAFLLGVVSLAIGGCRGHSPAPPVAGPPARPPATATVASAATATDTLAMADEPDAEDVTAQARELNSARYLPPPTRFRQGSVKPTSQLPTTSVTPNGFEVKLPSGAPVVTPAVHRGLVVVSGGFHSRQYYAFKAKTGSLKWGIDLDDDGPSTPACEGRVCVFNTESCTIFAVDAESGEMLWSWWLGDPLMSAPTIAAGRVFTSYPVGGAVYSQQAIAPVPPPPAAVVPGTPSSGSTAGAPSSLTGPPNASHAIGAFDLTTGKPLWQRWIDADVMSAPVASGNALFVATFAGTIYELDQADGTIRSAKARRATSAPVIADGGIMYTRRTDSQGAGTAPAEAVAREHIGPAARALAHPDDGGKNGGGKGAQQYVGKEKAAPYLDHKVQASSTYYSFGKALDAGNGFSGGAPASANAAAALGLVGQGSVSTLQAFQGSRLLFLGKLAINSMGDEVTASEAATGRKLWSYKLAGDARAAGGFLAAPPVAAGKQVLVATLGGELQLVEPDTGACK
jgi:outer membrane protein assembly factor BamB